MENPISGMTTEASLAIRRHVATFFRPEVKDLISSGPFCQCSGNSGEFRDEKAINTK